MNRWLLSALSGLILMACDSASPFHIPRMQWEGTEFALQLRPPVPRRGMNEFLIIGTREGRKPLGNAIVSLRVSESRPWRQAIQDGRTGVYRRALALDDPSTQSLQVRIQWEGKTGEISFPLHGRKE